jgi:peptidyl-dipeptidase Dcp
MPNHWKRMLLASAVVATVALLVIGNMSSRTGSAKSADPNPLLSEWTGPYGGLPPFDQVKVEYFKPALEAAMAENLTEIDKIANDSAPPTFENTIVALEKAGQTLDRVGTVYAVWQSTMSSPDFQVVQREMAPKLAAFSDKITQNEKLFNRIETVYNSPEKKKLNGEQQRLVWLDYTNFVRSGAKLDAKSKARLTEINQQLATLFTKFSNNVLWEEGNQFVQIKNEADLAGLPQSVRDAAAAAASEKKQEGWLIINTRSSVEPFLTFSDRRDLREKVWRMFIMRGDNGDEHDNNATITQILQLRAERAKLLGYQTHAHWRVENQMAKTPERAMDLMMAVWKPAVQRVHEEVADMQALVAKEGSTFQIAPWDYRYYMERVRKAKYDLDQNEVKPYLQLDKLREAIHWVAGELFNFKFTPAPNVPVAHPDIKVWEVSDKTTGKHIGLWYFDPFARPGKRSGAWMNAYRSQERVNGEITTIVSNNANFVKGKPGEPLLISWDDASTMFHEFGHALHGLNSNVTYPSLSGTAVARDYVEFPSQLMEHWLSTPQVLQKFALHYQTGKPIPQELVDKINRTKTFNQGFATVEYLAAAILDMKLHLLGDKKIDAREFEKEALAEIGMPKEIVLRHRLPHFLHVFSSDSYSAGYYSYLWSDVLTADAFGAFTEAGGPYDRKVADRLRKSIFSVGNTIDPAEAYRNFRGRDPKVEALMKKRGFGS